MRRSIAVSLFALTIISAGTPKLAAGQPEADSAGNCFAGRALPHCKTFWITEWGFYQPLTSTEFVQRYETTTFDVEDFGNHLGVDVGLMSNLNSRQAIGGVFHLGVSQGWRTGLKGRYRHWLSGERKRVVDLSAGVLRAPMRDQFPDFDTQGVGVTGDVSLGLGNWIAVTIRGDALRGGGRTAAATYGGVRLGSYAGIAATALTGFYVLLIYVAYSGAGT